MGGLPNDKCNDKCNDKILRVEYLALRVTLVGLGKTVPVKHHTQRSKRHIYKSSG